MAMNMFDMVRKAVAKEWVAVMEIRDDGTETKTPIKTVCPRCLEKYTPMAKSPILATRAAKTLLKFTKPDKGLEMCHVCGFTVKTGNWDEKKPADPTPPPDASTSATLSGPKCKKCGGPLPKDRKMTCYVCLPKRTIGDPL
jgi:hypothetical protein